MESWQFVQSPAGDWYWVCSNVISRQTRTSTATFKTRMECVANAMGSGYQKVVPEGASNKQQRHKAPSPDRKVTAKRAQHRNRSKSGKRSKPN